MAARTKTKGLPLPPREPKPGDLVLTKKDVVRRELTTAVRLNLSGGDPVAIHVLTSAATQVLDGVARKGQLVTSRRMFLEQVKPEYHTAIIDSLNAGFNFMKHGGRDLSETFDAFNPADDEVWLAFACLDYIWVFKDSFLELNLFMVLKHCELTDMFGPKARELWKPVADHVRRFMGVAEINRAVIFELLKQADNLEVLAAEIAAPPGSLAL